MPSGAQHSAAEILEQLKEIIEQQLQVVTYKWLARHCAISASLAKQLLFAFADAHRGKIAATYFLSGWTKPVADASCSGRGAVDGSGNAGGGSGRRHVAQLVDAVRLEARKAELAEVTSLHVYSVQPAQPKDTAELWNTDQVQMEALFARLLKGSGGADGGDATDSGCVPGAALSAVACEAAVRDPARGPRRAAAAKPPPEPPAAAKPKKPGPAEVLEALKSDLAQRGGAKAQQPGGAELRAAGAAAAPAANGIAKPQGNSRQPAAKAAKPGSKMAGMWSKAPPKRKQPAAPAAQATAAVGGDADAALRAAQQDEAGSSSSDEDVAVAPRGRARGKRVVADLEDDSDEGEEAAQAAPSPAQAAEAAPQAANGKAGSKAAAKAPKAPAAKRGRKSAPAAQDADAAAAEADPDAADAAAPAAKGKTKGKAAKAAPGHIKLGAETGGAAKRRKVMRTYYDDDGEEVTEMVWEDELPAEGQQPPSTAAAVPSSGGEAPMETEGPGGAGAAAAAPAEGRELAKTRSGSPAGAASSAKGSGLSGPAGPQKGAAKGSGGAKGSGAAKASGGAAKKSGKGKAPPPNQRSLKSFFGKK